MEQIKPPLPEKHSEYDAHLLHASNHGPHQQVAAMQVADRQTKYINPWILQWHTRPKIDSSPFVIEDFVDDVRNSLLRTIPELLRKDTSALKKINMNNTTILMRHISHAIVQHACALHTGNISLEQMLTIVRRDLQQVMQQRQGSYVIETPAHPFWGKYRGENVTQSGGSIARFVTSKKPTVPEKNLAGWLAGPNTNIKGPDGRIADILRSTHPFLLELDSGMMIHYATDLRRDIKRIVDAKPVFDNETRHECIELIADQWLKSLPKKATEQTGAHMEDWDMPVSEILQKHFPPEVISDLAAFEEKRFVLEQTTILTVLEANGDASSKIAEIYQIFSVWEKAMIKHKLCLSDYPTLGLAFLAADACTNNRGSFRNNI
ncbi:hypothetical protein KKF55_03955 [Patescibacteria group bacterium]|nr:hypothetical protein [Patescibacteria group bacterium]